MSYHKDINTINLHAWRKCAEESNFRYCRLDPFPKAIGKQLRWWVRLIFYKKPPTPPKLSKQTDEEAWKVVYDSNIKAFGLGEDYEWILDLKRRIAEVSNDIAITGEVFLLNKRRHLQEELDEILNRPIEADTDTAINYLSKWQGVRVDPKKITYRAFKMMLRDYQNEARAQKEAAEKVS